MRAGKTYFVPSILKASDILKYIRRAHEATFLEISSQLKIPRTSAYQILNTLEHIGFIRKSSESNKYRLGLSLFELGNEAVARLDLRTEAYLVLKDLMLKTNQTCHLGILDGAEGVYLAKVENIHQIRINSWEGKRLPLHCTSMGKVLLAWLDKDRIDKILNKTDFTRFTENTITDRSEFKQQLAGIRKRGWALDDQETELLIRCVAAPVFDAEKNVIAAISVSGLAVQMGDATLSKISKYARESARQLSNNLGYRRR